MPKKKLSSQFIKGLKPPEKPVAYYDTLESGLILRLSKAGSKTFGYRYRMFGKNRRYTIGTFPAIRLSEARKQVQLLKVEVIKGNDPQADKQEKKSRQEPKIFDDLAHAFKKRHLPTLKESTKKSYRNRIDSELLPFFGGRMLKTIDRTDVIELLEEILDRGQPYQANRVRAILSSMFNFGVQRGIAEFNPVKVVKPLGTESKRDRVLQTDEIKALWETFHTLLEPACSLLKILLLLGQRLGETSRMQWTDISGGVWVIPKEQTKANRKHTLPLPILAQSIIESLANGSPYVFESSRYPGQPVQSVNGSFRAALKNTGIENARIHDLRRTCATNLAEMGTDRTILGKVLNHKGLSGDSQVTARYDRYEYLDEKKMALNRWSHKLQQIVEGTEANITKLG